MTLHLHDTPVAVRASVTSAETAQALSTPHLGPPPHLRFATPPVPQLTAMCFDKNERRLVTAGGNGTVYIWNFNNGSKLREYAHGDEPLELCSVSHTEGQRGSEGRGFRGRRGGRLRKEEGRKMEGKVSKRR